MKKRIIILPVLLIIFLFLFCSCKIEFDDFKIECNDENGTCNFQDINNNNNNNTDITNVDTGTNTELGKEIKVSEKVKDVCKYIINDETTMVRLYRCPCGKYNCMYSSALPGGAGRTVVRPGMGRGDSPWYTEEAKNAIPIIRYIKGAFTSEQPGVVEKESSFEFAKAFLVLFRGDFVGDYRFKYNSDTNEIEFYIGTCTQCYSDANMIQKYDSGQYKDVIDKLYEASRYLIMVNDDGSLTETEYAGFPPSGPTFVMDEWSKSGMNFIDILKKMRGYDSPYFRPYKTSNIYDCRNLYEN